MANILGQPTIQEVSNVMCDKCNAVICLGCPVYELDKQARVQQNAHLTPETQATSQAVVNASALDQSDGDTPPAQAQVA